MTFLDGDTLTDPSAAATTADADIAQRHADANAALRELRDKSMVVVEHGATAGTSRPSSAGYVRWDGTVEPTNAENGDWWWDETNSLVKVKVSGSFVTAGSGTYEPAHWDIDLDVYAPPSAQSNWSTLSHDTAAIYGARMVNAASPNDQNSYREWKVGMTAGTWSIWILHQEFSSCGIITVSIDGTDVGTIDTYAASTTANQGFAAGDEISGITVASSGTKALRFTMATKNASSSGYRAAIQRIKLVRTA